MKETKLRPEELQVINSNHGLQAYLSGLSKGHEATPRSSLYNLVGKTEILEPSQILHRWQKILSGLESGSSYDREVFQFDESQLSKWGPQGHIAPVPELLEDIIYPTFLSSDNFKPQRQCWERAKRDVVKELHNAGCRGLTPVPYARVVDDMRARDTLESNSGWPLFTKRNKKEVVSESLQAARNGDWKTYPAITGLRNYNLKTRLVWMFPMAANIVEGSYTQALQPRLMSCGYWPAEQFLAPWIGFDRVRHEITGVWHLHPNLSIGASDFSKTDEHFKLASTLEVFDVIKECFQPRFRDGLRESMVHMHEVPLIISSDTKLEGTHGVASGSNWTNFVETIFDWIFSQYVFRTCLASDLDIIGFYAIGDDMTWTCDREVISKLPEILAKLGEEVGQLINTEKVSANVDSVKTLQRLVVRGQLRPDGQIRAVYSTIRALKSIIYPERFHDPRLWTKDMEAVRTFMILENCIDHPLFEKFCAFVSAGDPNLAVVARLKASEQDDLLRESKRLRGLNTTYNQEKRSSRLSTFQSVKLIGSR